MIEFPKQETIVTAVLEGIKQANDNFLFWTNDRLSLSHGPQKIITLHVAGEIAKIENAPEVFIDATVADILRCSLPDRKAFFSYMQKNNISQDVFSITLDDRFKHSSNNDSISRVIISVKNGVRNAKLEYSNEIERLCKMLNPDACENSTLGFAVFAFYSDLSNSARKKLDKRLPELVRSFDVVVKKFPRLKARFESGGIKHFKEGEGEWASGAYIIEPVKNEF